MTERTIWALAEQLKKGDFEPAGFEVAFSAIDNLSAMKIRLSEEEQLHLRGRSRPAGSMRGSGACVCEDH